jgi:hypothetical protein
MKITAWLIAITFLPVILLASIDKKVYNIVKTSDKIIIDGDLSERSWSQSQLATNFVQLEPNPGDEPSFQTEVYMLYDDEAIYISAKMLDNNPELILRELVERDGRGNADRFFVTFDTYKDGFNGVEFEVSAAGVQRDVKYSFSGIDSNWDAVWESAVKIVDDGWIVEMKIPYLSLRFPETANQDWHLQLGREIRRFREQSYWNEIDPEANGFLIQSGNLLGLKDIEPPTRISFTPYFTTYLNSVYDPGLVGDKFDAQPAYTAGMDMKLGLNDAFTLDMTLIPDFGQIVSDNQVLNLSPFEIRFDENRPFFTEGTELFNKGGVFYSRRVGGRPLMYNNPRRNLAPDEILLSNPDVTNLYNATKVSGRNINGLGIGVFNAVAKEMYAKIGRADGTARSELTNPLTNYNMVVLDQNLSNNSYITFLNTNVMRSGSAYDANVTGITFSRRNKGQSYSVNGGINVSQKYFTDFTDVGHTAQLEIEKISGNFQGELSYLEKSENYDANDMGLVFAPNERALSFGSSYNRFEPTAHFLSYRIKLKSDYKRLYDPNVFTDFNIKMDGFLLFKSRFAWGLDVIFEPIETFDYFEPRTSDFSSYFTWPKSYSIGSFISSDYRRTLAIDARIRVRRYDHDFRNDIYLSFGPRVRVSNNFSFSLKTELNQNDYQAGYVSLNALSPLPTGVKEGDIMLGERNRTVFENAFSGKYIFSNTMSLNFRVRHYWDKVLYQRFGILQNDGSLATIEFDGDKENGTGVYDRNFNIFNVDMNYIWRFAPGSDIIVNWKNQIAGDSFQEVNNYFSNLGSLFNQVQQNNFSIKIVYWLDYNKLTS